MSARKRRMSHTNVARVQLVASPLLMLVLFVLTLLDALCSAARLFAEDVWGAVKHDCRWLYRDVYRVARYGSVWDELDDRGRPKAWSR